MVVTVGLWVGAMLTVVGREWGMPRRSPSVVLVHLVWATSQRRPYLVPALDERVCAILGQKAGELRCQLLAAGCASDHVHVVVRLASTVAVSELVQRMKGASARELNQGAVVPRDFGWQDGYWAESVDPANVEATSCYVRAQRQHHTEPHPPGR